MIFGLSFYSPISCSKDPIYIYLKRLFQQLYRWSVFGFEELTSGIQTFNGMSVDAVTTTNGNHGDGDGNHGNLLLVLGNHFNRVWNSYKILSNIYSWSPQTGFSLCGGVETNKVMRLKFMKV